jgi:hypothetical protein
MFTVQLERLDPAMPKTQKEKPTKRIRKHTKETREHHRKVNEVYRKEINSGFNLLMKWVPGTETSTRPDIMKKTVNYIKELLNKVKELEKESPMECTPQTPTGMERDSVPNTDCTDSALREPLIPHSSYSSEMVDGTVVVSTPMEIGASEEIRESVILSPEEELLRSVDEEELLVSPEEEMELLASLDEEELPEFNSIEDVRQWLEL